MSEKPTYGDYQYEIYFDGLRGIQPKYPVDFAGLEKKAAEALPWWIHNYVAGGCGDWHTQAANVAAFGDYGIVPRMFRAGVDRDISIDLFGHKLPTPLFLCPIGVIGIVSQDFHGDIQTAAASSRAHVPMVASTLTQDPLEDVAAQFGDTPGFFQLYTPNDRDLALSFINRAEKAGFSGIVVTLDAWTTGWRPGDLNYASFPQLRGLCLENYFSDPNFLKLLDKPVAEDQNAAIHTWMKVWGQPITWDDLPWLRAATKLPLLVKGVSHPEDARRALDAGVDGIYCSNHGGRQANGGVPSLYNLPKIVKAAGGAPVLFDSGIRSGTDVAKALALGATAVGIGRPYAYALALGGADGVVQLLRSILAELDLLMAVDGHPTIQALRESGIEKIR